MARRKVIPTAVRRYRGHGAYGVGVIVTGAVAVVHQPSVAGLRRRRETVRLARLVKCARPNGKVEFNLAGSRLLPLINGLPNATVTWYVWPATAVVAGIIGVLAAAVKNL